MSGEILRYLDRLQPLALLLMRLVLGAVVTVHGYQNVFHHLHDHAHVVTSLGMPASVSYVSSLAELVCGLLVIVGFFTRPAAFALCVACGSVSRSFGLPPIAA